MKLLFLNPWERLIGPNRYLIEMLRHAPELAKQSTVVFPEDNDAQSEYKDLGCHVLVWPEVSLIHAKLSFKNILSLLKRHTFGLVRVLFYIRSERPDIIVINGEQLFIGNLASGLLGIPSIKIFHGITFFYRLKARPRVMKAYLYIITLWNNIIVAVSETARDVLIRGGMTNKKIVVIPNPIPIEELKTSSLKPLPGEVKKLIDGKGPIILNVGGISPLKGQDQLVEALPLIKKIYPKMLCIFAGDVVSNSGIEDTHDYFKSIQNRVRLLGLGNNIVFLGRIDFLPSLFHSVDLYVHTARTESFGRAVAEALTCLKPTVVFDVDAVPEVAGPGAVLVKAGDTQGLARAIIDLLSNPDQMEQLALQGSKHVEMLYDADNIAKKFMQILLTVASR